MKLRIFIKDNKITSVVEDEYNNTTYTSQAHMVGELDELLPIIEGSVIDYSLLWHDNKYMDRYNIDDFDAEQISNHPNDETIIRKAFVVGWYAYGIYGLNIVVKHYNESNEYIPETHEDVLVKVDNGSLLDGGSWHEQILWLNDKDEFNSSIY